MSRPLLLDALHRFAAGVAWRLDPTLEVPMPDHYPLTQEEAKACVDALIESASELQRRVSGGIPALATERLELAEEIRAHWGEDWPWTP
jgi:hypothetical protein